MVKEISCWLVLGIFISISGITLAEEEVVFKRSDATFPETKKRTLVKRHKGAVIFDYQYENQKNYSLLLGEVKFQESSDVDDSGFYASELKEVKGDVTRTVYDYTKSASSDEVINDLRRKLKAKGFKEVYSCEGEQCGSVSGWQTFLYSKLGGTDNEQRYFVASKDKVTVAFYINVIADQARGVMDVIDFSNNNLIAMAPLSAKETVEIFFASGQSKTKIIESANISDMVMTSLKDEKSLIVKGFTDITGSEEANSLLSLERAKYVKSILTQIYSVPDEKIEVLGMGVDPLPVSDNSEARKKSRRVEITIKQNS